MTATRLNGSPTLYSVTSERRLRCSKIGCVFNSEAKRHKAGDPCPKCEAEALAMENTTGFVTGSLEPQPYQCDLSAFQGTGNCTCERWQMHFGPLVRAVRPADLLAMTDKQLNDSFRCKHVKCAMGEAVRPDNLRALLLALPVQEQEQGP